MLQEKFFRFQLSLFKPFADNCSLEMARDSQDKLGQVLTTKYKKNVSFEDCKSESMNTSMITPRDKLSDGIILYLHGGGYTCGDISYAKGFGTTLAAKCGINVYCISYRLAPEAPFPAAVDDALTAYRHLLSIGYSSKEIILCGESAGGGLIYALCLRLKELGYAMPAGLIAISPWTDLTLSGQSFKFNRDIDPSMTKQRLKYYADCYAYGENKSDINEANDIKIKQNPLISPLFGELTGLPPSLFFVGGDEVMLDDTRMMNNALIKAGCHTQVIVKENMWHAYVLYCLRENESDFLTISQFLKDTISRQRKLHWMRLDNAAKIYPAIKTRQWNNFFRVSATLNDPIDRDVLKSALDVTVRRFPSIAVRLKKGVFWYYLEEIPKAPPLLNEGACPLIIRPFDRIHTCAIRVIVYKNRIATEFFHAITDGSGGLIFLKTLVAEYLTQKYGVKILPNNGVLDRLEQPKKEELEDSFIRYNGNICASRRERNAYQIKGSVEKDRYLNNTVFIAESSSVASIAGQYKVTVSAFLTAVLIKAAIALQEEQVKNPKRRKDVRVLLPVNLRSLFDSITLRNFALYIIPGVDVRLGSYSFEEICSIVTNQMRLELTQKEMQKRIAVNVKAEKYALLKIAPLFLKNIVMKAVYNTVGEKKSCLCFSNLGVIQLPNVMFNYVNRMDFVLGSQAHTPYNVSALSFHNNLYINFVRTIKEPLLEYHFYKVLQTLGVKIKTESNQRD